MWTATASLPSSIVFMVQAASGTGLVSLSTNSGAYYAVGATMSVAAPVSITVRQAPAQGTYQATSGLFTVSLVNGNGAPLANQVVTVQVGSRQAFGTTGSDGTATITMPLNQPPGTYTVFATFAGAAGYAAASSPAGTLTITPGPTTLTLTTAAGVAGTVPITATVTDSNGNGLPQRTVVFTITGHGFTETQTAITDYLGRAVRRHLCLPTGSYTVTAAFGGTDIPVRIAAGGSTVTIAVPITWAQPRHSRRPPRSRRLLLSGRPARRRSPTAPNWAAPNWMPRRRTPPPSRRFPAPSPTPWPTAPLQPTARCSTPAAASNSRCSSPRLIARTTPRRPARPPSR